MKHAERSGLVHKAVASLFPLANVNSKELIQKNECDNIPFYFEDGKKFEINDNFDRRCLLLGAEDMCDHGFPAPVPGCLGYKDPEYSFSHEEYKEVRYLCFCHFPFTHEGAVSHAHTVVSFY